MQAKNRVNTLDKTYEFKFVTVATDTPLSDETPADEALDEASSSNTAMIVTVVIAVVLVAIVVFTKNKKHD